jgi:hypothetical protein
LKYHRLKARWCQGVIEKLRLAVRLKYHRLKARWCQSVIEKPRLAVKLKYHRLKPSGVHHDILE